jgi:hypothetical protein
MLKSPIEYEITAAAVSGAGDGRALINCQTADQQPLILHLGRETLQILCAEAAVVVKADRRKLPHLPRDKKNRPE